MPDSEWLTDPLSADPTDPTIKLPRLQLGQMSVQPLFVDAGTTQGERAMNVQVFQILNKRAERLIAAWIFGQVSGVILKAFMTNPLLFDDTTLESTRGPATQFLTDLLHTIFARLTECLSILDADAYKEVMSIYVDPWQGPARTFFNGEADLHEHLVANGMARSSQQKMIAFDVVFKSNFNDIRFKMLFEDANRTDAARTWANS
jgi:hypothetical protein